MGIMIAKGWWMAGTEGAVIVAGLNHSIKRLSRGKAAELLKGDYL
jgi:hypothetical protein